MEETCNPLCARRGTLCTFLKVLFQTTLSDRNYSFYSANEKAEVQKG